MGGPSEREYREKLSKTREKSNRRGRDLRKDFTQIEKMKLDALKNAEEMRRSADREIDKIEKNVIESKDLAPESKERLRLEIDVLRNEVEETYSALRTRISQTLTPAMVELKNI